MNGIFQKLTGYANCCQVAELSTDVITGFCTETEEDHHETLSLMEYCEYDLAYMFFYSERPGTLAARRYNDDVPEEVKKRRLQEVVALHRIQSLKSMQKEIGKTLKVLIEGNSKKSDEHWSGRSDNNKVVVFPKSETCKKAIMLMVIIEQIVQPGNIDREIKNLIELKIMDQQSIKNRFGIIGTSPCSCICT